MAVGRLKHRIDIFLNEGGHKFTGYTKFMKSIVDLNRESKSPKSGKLQAKEHVVSINYKLIQLYKILISTKSSHFLAHLST